MKMSATCRSVSLVLAFAMGCSSGLPDADKGDGEAAQRAAAGGSTGKAGSGGGRTDGGAGAGQGGMRSSGGGASGRADGGSNAGSGGSNAGSGGSRAGSGGSRAGSGSSRAGSGGSGGSTEPTTTMAAGAGGADTESEPQAVAIKSLALGGRTACRVLESGVVECWGLNGFGELGNNTTTASQSPGPVKGIDNATAVAVGTNHACALLTDGSVSCWGDNTNGVLGDGTTTKSLVPVKVQSLGDAVAIAAGSYQTCAIRKGGKVSCWGYNASGQLGTGMTGAALLNSAVPVPVIGVSSATAITSGGQHVCALVDDGKVLCWGNNQDGELGNGESLGNSASPVSVAGDFRAKSIAAGSSHMCAVLTSGTVKCWGATANGRLGATASSGVKPLDVEVLSDVEAVASGEAHSCAVRSDGSVYCWGWNNFMQLGNGSTTDAMKPALVAGNGLGNAVSIAAGRGYSCALLKDRTQQCWGTL